MHHFRLAGQLHWVKHYIMPNNKQRHRLKIKVFASDKQHTLDFSVKFPPHMRIGAVLKKCNSVDWACLHEGKRNRRFPSGAHARSLFKFYGLEMKWSYAYFCLRHHVWEIWMRGSGWGLHLLVRNKSALFNRLISGRQSGLKRVTDVLLKYLATV